MNISFRKSTSCYFAPAVIFLMFTRDSRPLCFDGQSLAARVFLHSSGPQIDSGTVSNTFLMWSLTCLLPSTSISHIELTGGHEMNTTNS